MAGFRMHVGTSSALGVGYAGALHTMYGVPLPTAAVAGTLCGLAGMLPDLDSDTGLPLREVMSFAAATIPVLMINRFESLELSRNAIVIISIGLYLFVRFGIASMIRKFTVHRGMFHSIPAMLTFGGITYLVTGGFPLNERYMMAGGVMAGFFSHLMLDEIYSIEFKTGRWRTKKSFGSAIKLWGSNGKSNVAAYAKLAVVGMGVVGDPTSIKNFVTNRPELASRLNEAMTIVGDLGKNDPQLSGKVDQLKNILGTLNQAGTSFPQDGGAWPGTPSSHPPSNNPYPYAGPASASAAPSQYIDYPTLPPQQLSPTPPLNNQRPDWQWPGSNQSSANNSQPPSFQNGYDTAQRPMGQYPQ